MPVRTSRRRGPALTTLEHYLLEYGELPPTSQRDDYPGNRLEAFLMSHPSLAGPCWRYDLFRACWATHRAEFMADWVARHPGTRPFAWWLIQAPRQTLADGTRTSAPEPLRQVSGTGMPIDEGVYGEDIAMARGVRPFERVDRADPPQLESEASYLNRHGLFVDGERARLSTDAFVPTILDLNANDDDDEARRDTPEADTARDRSHRKLTGF